MYYPARIKKSENVYQVHFPDLPNIITYGETLKDAIFYAEEALNGVLECEFERNFYLPSPSKKTGRYYHNIPVRPHIAIAYTLKKIRKNKSQSHIAHALGISYQAYQRLENPRACNPTVKTLEKIGGVLGKRLDVRFS